MRILQIVPELRSGGVERGTVDFAIYLLSQGHHSVVVSAGGSLVQSMAEAGVTHYTLPVHRKSLFSIMAQSKRLAQILKKERIDVVHARSRVPAWIVFLACRKVRIPLVTTCHGVYNTHAFSRVMGWGKLVIVISHAVSRHMKEQFCVPYHRIRLIHRGVNLDEFTREESRLQEPVQEIQPGQERIISIVGRITPIKGHAVLLKAMARVCRVIPEAKLWIIGEAPRRRYLAELKLLAQKLGIESQVSWLGTRHDIPELLKKMDLLVAPAVGEEAFGRVLIEAGACEVPVIASRIGGIVDVIEDGVDGRLVPAGDPAALAESVLATLQQPELAARFAKKLNKKVYEKFSDKGMFEKTLGVYDEVLKKPTILVIKLSALGDVILSTPSFRAIREKYPEAKIVALTECSSRPVLRHSPYVDDVITCERFNVFGMGRFLQIAQYLAKEQFDICVDLQNNRWSHVLAYFSGAHTRVGYGTGKLDSLINVKTKNKKDFVSPVEHQFRLLRGLGIDSKKQSLELWTDPRDEARMEQFLKDNWLGEGQTLVGLNPGSSAVWKTKQWPLERFAFLCDQLSKENIRVVITGTAQEAAMAKVLTKKTRSKPIIACGQTNVGELIALVKRCHVFVTSDSAPLHIASAVGTPFVALFGPTDPRRHVEAPQGPFSVLWKEVKCSPCYLKKCPIGHMCMKQISQDEVLSRVQGLLQAYEKNDPTPVNEPESTFS